MFRFFYRSMRRDIRRRLTDDYLAGAFLTDITKWWFDFVRNLVLASLFAFYAQRSGSWLAYVLAHFSFIFLFFFLFHPVFRFMIRASHTTNRKIQRQRVTTVSMWMFLNVLSLGVGATLFVVLAMAQFQVR